MDSTVIQYFTAGASIISVLVVSAGFIRSMSDRGLNKFIAEVKREFRDNKLFVTPEQCQASSNLMDLKLDEVTECVNKIDKKTSDIYKVLDTFRERLSLIEGYLKKSS